MPCILLILLCHGNAPVAAAAVALLYRQVWDMNIGDCVMQLARDAPLTAVGLTPDSASAVVAAADGTAAVWSLATGQVTHTLSGHTAK